MYFLRRTGSWLIAALIIALLFGLMGIRCTQKTPMDPMGAIQDEIPSLINMIASPSQIATGGARTEIRVRLVDRSSTPLEGRVVQFSTTLGSITPQDTTDAQGYAFAVLTSGSDAGWARVTAVHEEDALAEISVQFLASALAFLRIEAANQNLLANGIDGTPVTVTVLGDSAEAVAGAQVFLFANVGEITPSVIIDSQGRGTADFTSTALNRDTTATIRAAFESDTVALSILLRGIQIEAAASPTAIRADGNSVSTISVLLKETVSQVAIPDASVRFGTDKGTIPGESQTDASGIARVDLTSSDTPDTARVTVYYGNLFSDTVQVAFTSDTPQTNTFSLLNASPDAILADGVDQTTISVAVVDAQNRAVQGQLIRFQTTAGTIPPQAVTDVYGRAEVALRSEASRNDINAVVTVQMDTVIRNLPVLMQGVHLSVGAQPTVIRADGQSTSQITALLKRAGNQVAISGATVTFGTDLGTISNQSVTDDQGVARVTYVSATDTGTACIIARYGQTLADTVFVRCSTESHGINTLHQLTASPAVILANGMDQSKISVQVLDPQSRPVEGAVVAFFAGVGTMTINQAVSDADGIASVFLTSIAHRVDTTAEVKATLGTAILRTNVLMEGVNISLQASPETILADGQSVSHITAHLKRHSSQVAISGAEVYFGASLGSIPGRVTTDNQGIARADYVAGTDTGTAVITVHYGTGLDESVQVHLQETVPTYLDVTATPTSIPADGQSQATINATVTDANRNPVPDGTSVLFDILEGSGSIGHQRTTVDGVASSQLTSGTSPDTVHVVVSVGETLRDTVSVVYTVGEVNRIEITVNPDSLPADGVTKSMVQAQVFDSQNNPVQGITVNFSATLGDIIPSARTDAQGVAEVEYSSTAIGLATITAEAGGISRTITVKVYPGPPFAMTLSYSPHFIYVRECGKNQTVTVFADVRDEKNNPVKDGTYVTFSVYASPGQGDSLSTTAPKPTVNGVAQVSYTSGTRSGTSRIRAVVTDGNGVPITPEVSGISTEIVIYSGPPYIEDINDPASTHLTIVSNRLNIWAGEDTTRVTALVGDRYNNPVQQGTAVYFTTSGGVITTQAYTDANGIAHATLIGGNPLPTIDRFYNYDGVQDPNLGTPIPGPLPDFENSQVINTEGNLGENDGIARVIAHVQGVDSLGNSARVWDRNAIVLSMPISHFEISTTDTVLTPGQFATIAIELWDVNGNPVVGGSLLTAAYAPASASAELSWEEKETGDPGSCFYTVNLFNAINPMDPNARATYITVTISIQSVNGNYERSLSIYLDI
jgi:hypothetical protein